MARMKNREDFGQDFAKQMAKELQIKMAKFCIEDYNKLKERVLLMNPADLWTYSKHILFFDAIYDFCSQLLQEDCEETVQIDVATLLLKQRSPVLYLTDKLIKMQFCTPDMESVRTIFVTPLYFGSLENM